MVACLRTGVYIYDVQNPMLPNKIGVITWGQGAWYHLGANVLSLEVDVLPNGDSILHICSRTSSVIEIFDVTNAANPIYLLSIPEMCDWSQYPNLPPHCFTIPSGQARGLHIVNGILYSGWYNGGFKIHDVSIASSPVELAARNFTNAYVHGIQKDPNSNVLYTIDTHSSGAFRSWDLSNLGNIQPLDSYQGSARTMGASRPRRRRSRLPSTVFSSSVSAMR